MTLFALKLKGLFISVKTPRKQSSQQKYSPISVEKYFQILLKFFKLNI